MEYNIFATDAQASFNQVVDGFAQSQEPPFPPCLYTGEEYEGGIDERAAAYPSVSDQEILAAVQTGRQFIATMRSAFLTTRRSHKSKPVLIRSKAVRLRARRSPAAHGGAPKPADDGGGSGDGGGEPPHKGNRATSNNPASPFLAPLPFAHTTYTGVEASI
jgi:hypothetical protein